MAGELFKRPGPRLKMPTMTRAYRYGLGLRARLSRMNGSLLLAVPALNTIYERVPARGVSATGTRKQ